MNTLWDTIELQQAAELLTAGEPPLFVQLLLLNAICLIIWIAARTLGKRIVSRPTLRLMQVAFLALNLVIVMMPGNDLYQLVGLG